MWEFIKENVFIIGALTGSVAAYILGMIVNYIKRERKVLGYSIVSRKIVEGGHKDLTIHFKGQLIQRLFSHQVTINNVGNRALKDLPVRIKFSDVFIDPELSQPEGADFKMTIVKNEEIVVTCDLLKLNEKFKVGFTSFDVIEEEKFKDLSMPQKEPVISVIVREENLECKDLDASVLPSSVIDFAVAIAYESVRSILKTKI